MSRVIVYRCDAEGCSASVDKPLPNTWLTNTLSNGGGHRCPEHVLRECSKCGAMCRPQRFTLAQYPGTVRIAKSNDMCVNCDRADRPVGTLHPDQEKFIRRLVRSRLDDPDDRLLVLNQLGVVGADID